MSFWNRGKEAAFAGFVGGVGANIGSSFINRVRRLMSGTEGVPKVADAAGAQLLLDFQAMPDSETANIRRRFKEALQRNEADRFVSLLSTIPWDGDQGRQASLRYLNSVSDQEFEKMMELLEHPQSASDKLAGHIGALADRIEGSKGEKPRA